MTDAMTPTLKPIPLKVQKKKRLEIAEGCETGCWRRTISLVNPPLAPRTRCKFAKNMQV